MHRSNRHGRAGHFMMATSAADNVLWDLRGRMLGLPVFRLLGGSRARVPVYASCLGFSLEPGKAEAKARSLQAEGCRAQKWFLAHGPAEGREGLVKNVDLVRRLREAVGDDTDLMFDAFMGWDLPYALAWAKEAEPFRPRWIEEAFPPDHLESFAALREATSIPVASGEHFYGRWEVERYLAARALHVVQADPEWCGGVSELVKIATLASAHDAHVVPHGHALHAALHVVASQSPATCPMGEYLLVKMALRRPPLVLLPLRAGAAAGREGRGAPHRAARLRDRARPGEGREGDAGRGAEARDAPPPARRPARRPLPARGLGFLDESAIRLRVWPNDLDANLHMNNSRYLLAMDLGRWELVMRTGLLARAVAPALVPGGGLRDAALPALARPLPALPARHAARGLGREVVLPRAAVREGRPRARGRAG